MTAIEQGLIFVLPVLAVYLTSRIIAFDDLTCEGSFGIGGAVLAAAAVAGWPLTGWSVAPTVLLAGGAGALAGTTTGLLHHHLKINNLICGIIVTTALFSVCLNLAGANTSLSSEQVGLSIVVLAASAIFAVLCIFACLRSEMGFVIRALGQNPSLLARLGKNQTVYRIGVLALANALTAIAGALFVQWSGYYSIFGNVGTLVIALSSLMIAEAFSRKLGLALIVGAVVYQLLFAMVLEFDLPPSYNSLLKAGLMVALMALRRSSHA